MPHSLKANPRDWTGRAVWNLSMYWVFTIYSGTGHNRVGKLMCEEFVISQFSPACCCLAHGVLLFLLQFHVFLVWSMRQIRGFKCVWEYCFQPWCLLRPEAINQPRNVSKDKLNNNHQPLALIKPRPFRDLMTGLIHSTVRLFIKNINTVATWAMTLMPLCNQFSYSL